MRKIILLLSLLVLYSCSKGDEQEVEAEDNRPLIERLESRVYGTLDRTSENGQKTYRGVHILKRTSPNALLPLIYQKTYWNTAGWSLGNNCESILQLVNRKNLLETSYDKYVVTSNHKDKYSSEWTIPIFNDRGDVDLTYFLKLNINSFDADKKLRVSLEIESDEFDDKRTETLDMEFLYVNRNSECRVMSL